MKPWFTPDNLFIISSDFSHYPSYSDAVKNDRVTAEAFATGNRDSFLSTLKTNSDKKIPGLATSMCGWSSGLMLLCLCENNENLHFNLVDYCNSGDSLYGSKDEVVGYHAISVTEAKPDKEATLHLDETLALSPQEKKLLFSIARESIRSRLYEKDYLKSKPGTFPLVLNKHLGAFVTLKIDGHLRGCIGRFVSDNPLHETVRLSALSAAFEDPRFMPLSREEYENVEVEITILGPLRKISSSNEIVKGKHGIFIRKGNRSGTMLAQVATENKWSVEEFLGYTSREKAGLGWDGWKEAELFVYDCLVLGEER